MSSRLRKLSASLWFLGLCSYCQTTTIDTCNRTVDAENTLGDDNIPDKVTFKLDSLTSKRRGQPYHCWFRLNAKTAQYVKIDVKGVRTGQFDENDQRCHDGYFRISEENENDPQWLPPTTLCGDLSRMRVKRLTTGSSAFVEFHVDHSEPSKGYEFDAVFIDKDPEEDLPYGHIHRKAGKINATQCDWLVPVETCFGGCDLISPGYPGIYMPNMKCRYTLMNFEDGRVQIKFGGKHGKFDLKKRAMHDGWDSSGERTRCTEDYIEIFDGANTADPLIGRYCGHDTDFVISTGTTMLVEFTSGAGSPPWDYSGFDINVVDRWKFVHDFGTKDADTDCDWLFLSTDATNGDIHTPDHMIAPQTTCIYTFEGRPDEKIKLQINLNLLHPNCQETIEVVDGGTQVDIICADRIKSKYRTETMTYTSNNNIMSVKYYSQKGRISNDRPVFVIYTFMNTTEPMAEYETSYKDDSLASSSSGTALNWGRVMTGPCLLNVMILALLRSLVYIQTS